MSRILDWLDQKNQALGRRLPYPAVTLIAVTTSFLVLFGCFLIALHIVNRNTQDLGRESKARDAATATAARDNAARIADIEHLQEQAAIQACVFQQRDYAKWRAVILTIPTATPGERQFVAKLNAINRPPHCSTKPPTPISPPASATTTTTRRPLP